MIKGAAALLLLAALGVAPAGPSTTIDLGTEAAAHRLTPDTIAWDLGPDPAGKSKQLGAAPAGGLVAGATGLTGGTVIPLTYDPAGLSPALKAKYPNLASLGALHVSADAARLLRGQVAVAAIQNGTLVAATGLQMPAATVAVFVQR
jgi:pullulanase